MQVGLNGDLPGKEMQDQGEQQAEGEGHCLLLCLWFKWVS